MRGIADASGVSLKLMRRIHMIGELTKGTCSMFGAWGKATPDGKAIQLRALDWVKIR
jgi:isopenicillin-N N-acyltransferase like protein